jgi:Kef-type K+ transport system membrane component KefB
MSELDIQLLLADLALIILLARLFGRVAKWLGAFLFGVVMPREDHPALREDHPPLRENILERLEQISVLMLLQVFFVISGQSVNLAAVGWPGPAELCLIMAVAVAGKMAPSSAAESAARQAGALAALLNRSSPQAHSSSSDDTVGLVWRHPNRWPATP